MTPRDTGRLSPAAVDPQALMTRMAQRPLMTRAALVTVVSREHLGNLRRPAQLRDGLRQQVAQRRGIGRCHLAELHQHVQLEHDEPQHRDGLRVLALTDVVLGIRDLRFHQSAKVPRDLAVGNQLIDQPISR